MTLMATEVYVGVLLEASAIPAFVTVGYLTMQPAAVGEPLLSKFVRSLSIPAVVMVTSGWYHNPGAIL